MSRQAMLAIARTLVKLGLAYASCWGEDCERWHDAIDWERSQEGLEEEGADGDIHDVITTTWHDGEPLQDALMFFGRFALPTPMYMSQCRGYVIAASPNYSDIIRKSFHSAP